MSQREGAFYMSESAFSDVGAWCKRVEQQTSFFCGAACCKMLLDRVGVAVAQPNAYVAIHDTERFKTEELYSDPIGVSKYINDVTPNTIDFDVKAFDGTDPKSLLDEIYFTIRFLQIPCLVLVRQGNHWVVVHGVRVSEGADGSRAICGVFIQDPWYAQADNKYVAATEFLSGWLTPVKWGVTWKGKLLIISDGLNHNARTPPPLISGFGPLLPRQAVAATTNHYLAGVGSLGRINKSAIDALTAHGFSEIVEIKSGGGADLLVPLDVTSIDGDDFTIVPMDGVASSHFVDFVYVALSAANGALLEICRLERAIYIHSDDEALSVLSQRFPTAKIDITPGYFWKSSFRTMSRFSVFRKVLIDSQVRYLFTSGDVATTLDDDVVAGG
ncbi:hypothetical protein [Zoogloea sp.]|uniref:hypothetical protein n=1 Tax=Zoogloea sp. TaxID=49181 RepID=UPI0035B12C9F